MAELRNISPDELKKILEAHLKWVESDKNFGEQANLFRAKLQEAKLFGANLQEANLGGANLQEADLSGADLLGANLRGTEGLTASQVKKARNWELAIYDDDFLKKLGLPSDHNEIVKKKLAELETKEKEADTKK